MNNIKLLKDYKSEKFRNVFTEYYKVEGVTLKPDTTVFDGMQNDSDVGKIKTYIIEKDDNIIAFIMYRIYKLKTDNKFLKQTIGYIMEFYVVPEERNKKLATFLLNKVENELMENKVCKIVLTAEPKVYDFYKKMGYYFDNSYTCVNKLICLVKNIQELNEDKIL